MKKLRNTLISLSYFRIVDYFGDTSQSDSSTLDGVQVAEFQRELDAGNLRVAGSWLVTHCADDVLGLCTALVRDRILAEDLAQDTFGKAFTSLSSYRGDASPRTWLLTIARNRCLDYLRRRRHTGLISSDPDAGDTTASDAPLPADLLGDRDEVSEALDALDETQRALIILRFRHGLSFDELSEVFGIKAGTARMRVSRALSRIRESLQQSRARAMPVAAPPRAGSRGAGGGARPSSKRRRHGTPPSLPPAAPPPAAASIPPPRSGAPSPGRPLAGAPPAPPGSPTDGGASPPSPPSAPHRAAAAPGSADRAFASALGEVLPTVSRALRHRLAELLSRL